MALPESRDFDPIDTGPLPAATVAAIQDAIVGAQHGEIITPFFDALIGTGAPVWGNDGWTAIGAATLDVPIRLPVGTVITRIEPYVRQQGAGQVTWELRYLTAGIGGSLLTNAGNATTGDKQLPTDTTQPLIAGRSYFLRVNLLVANDAFRFAEITHSKPS